MATQTTRKTTSSADSRSGASTTEKAAAAKPEAAPTNPPSHVVIDLGKKKRKVFNGLRNGRGKGMFHVQDCIDELHLRGQTAGTVQPVIVVVREKKERFGFMGLKF